MEKSIAFRNGTLRYRMEGSGQPLCLVHGFAEDGEVWNEQVEFLKSKSTLILPDLPGSGKSTPLRDDHGKSPSIADYAEGVRTIITHEKIEKFTLIGHSMGGYVSLAYAQAWQSTLTGLGLFHSTAYADSAEKITARQKGIAFINTHGVLEFLKQSTPNLFANDFKQREPGRIDKLIERGTNFSAATLVQYYEAMMVRPDMTGLLKVIEIPLLFVVGEEDKTLNLQDSLAQAHMPVLSNLHLFPHVAHMGMWESTTRSNLSIMKFLDQQKEY